MITNEPDHALDEFRGRLPAGQPRPVYAAESFGYQCLGLVYRVDRNGQNKRHGVRKEPRPLDGQVPLESKITFVPRLRGRRDDRQEIGTAANVALNLHIEVVAALKPALVEPHIDAGGFQCRMELLS